jgi:1,4-alpha-glucan branching enzyme
MAPYTFSLFAPYNKNCALRLKNANARMFGIDIVMDKNEETGYFYKTIDLADGKYHYQFKIVTKSWFEESPQPAKPTIANENEKPLVSDSIPQSKIDMFLFSFM